MSLLPFLHIWSSLHWSAWSVSKVSPFLRLNSRATSSRNLYVEKASVLRITWALATAVLTGSAILVIVCKLWLLGFMWAKGGARPVAVGQGFPGPVRSSKTVWGDAWPCHRGPHPALAREQTHLGLSPARKALTHLRVWACSSTTFAS